MFFVCYTAKDAAAFDGGIPISDIEMEETHGGFQTPNGNFLYFSMDFMHMEYLANNNPASPQDAGTLANLLGDQSSVLNNTNYEKLPEVPGVGGAINSNVTNNVGFTNVGVILGNNNVQQLYNFLNLNLAFFQVTNPNYIKPVLSNWLHLAF
jgi:hypothetical protein